MLDKIDNTDFFEFFNMNIEGDNKALSKKEIFLNKLKSKNGYKRYLGSPLRYAGGKSLAVGNIIELIPENITKVVSPFIGGGSVEIAIAKELGKIDWKEIMTTGT